MKRTGYKLLAKTLIALVLVIVSFAMLLLPWINISIEVMGRDYSLPDLLDLACRYEGITSAQFDLALQTEIADLSADLAKDTGVIVNTKEATKAVNRILDGGISLLDAATLSTYASGVLKDIDQAMSLNITKLSASERAVLIAISEASGTLSISMIVLWVVIAALVITFLLALLSLRTNSGAGTIAYTIVLAVPIVATVIGIGNVNELMQNYITSLTGSLSSALRLLGVGDYGVQSLELLHVSAAPVISLLCAIAAILIMVVTGIRIPGIKTPAMPTFKWTCSCGFQNNLSNAFCSSCGQKRPEKPRCECGAAIVPGTKFCGKCGKPIEAEIEFDPDPAPAPAKRCPRCGNVMEGDVCRRCVPSPQRNRECVRCGALVYGNDTLCTSCRSTGGGLRRGPWNKPSDTDLE